MGVLKDKDALVRVSTQREFWKPVWRNIKSLHPGFLVTIFIQIISSTPMAKAI